MRANENVTNSGFRGQGQHVYLFSGLLQIQIYFFTKISWMEVYVVGANTEAQSIHTPKFCYTHFGPWRRRIQFPHRRGSIVSVPQCFPCPCPVLSWLSQSFSCLLLPMSKSVHRACRLPQFLLLRRVACRVSIMSLLSLEFAKLSRLQRRHRCTPRCGRRHETLPTTKLSIIVFQVSHI